MVILFLFKKYFLNGKIQNKNDVRNVISALVSSTISEYIKLGVRLKKDTTKWSLSPEPEGLLQTAFSWNISSQNTTFFVTLTFQLSFVNMLPFSCKILPCPFTKNFARAFYFPELTSRITLAIIITKY